MKEWTEPQLTVLVRSKPEEGVLTACKTDNLVGPLLEDVNHCLRESEACQARTNS